MPIVELPSNPLEHYDASWRNNLHLCLDDYAFALLTAELQGMPTMPTPEQQKLFTGSSQWTTMLQAVNFLKAVERGYLSITGRSMENIDILDYGCGWGRMLRLLPVYSDSIFGCDPWDFALNLCRKHNVPGTLLISDYVPSALPFPNESMSLVYAYSVFTHTSLRATLQSSSAIRKVIAPDGVFVLTIRPKEFWTNPCKSLDPIVLSSVLEAHDQHGFAYLPHNGRDDFGDTSMTFHWIQSNLPEWKIVRYDRNLDDQYQLIVFLVPK